MTPFHREVYAMKDEQRINALEEEVKVLKNEIKTVLLDLREQCLTAQNPFGYSGGTTIAIPTSGQRESQAEETKAETSLETKAGGQVNMPESASRNTLPRLWQEAGPDDEEEAEEELLPKGPMSSHKRTREHNLSAGKSKVDLVVVAGLTHWIDQSTAKLGKERTEILVEMSFAMGHLPEKLKDALIRMIRVSHHELKGQSITSSDYLSILAQLENLLADPKQQDKALLSILSMMKESQNG